MTKEEEIDLSVFTKLLDPNNKFIEPSPKERMEQSMQELVDVGTKKIKSHRLMTLAERDRKRPKGFQV